MSAQPQKGEIILFQANDGHTKIQVRFEEKSFWLSQKSLAELYQVSVPSVNEHLSHIYEEGELASEATLRKFRIVQTEGKREVARAVDHYSLEAILAVGYPVRSSRGMQFRQWATAQLQELLVKGFVIVTLAGKVDAVVATSHRGNQFLRGRPNSLTSDNLDARG